MLAPYCFFFRVDFSGQGGQFSPLRSRNIWPGSSPMTSLPSFISTCFPVFPRRCYRTPVSIRCYQVFAPLNISLLVFFSSFVDLDFIHQFEHLGVLSLSFLFLRPSFHSADCNLPAWKGGEIPIICGFPYLQFFRPPFVPTLSFRRFGDFLDFFLPMLGRVSYSPYSFFVD